MSRLAYITLTTAPDMTEPPIIGLAAAGGRVDQDLGPSERFSAWVGITPLALSFRYRLGSPAVAIQFRNFMNQFKGRGFSFLLPSWIRDFRLAAAGTIGDTSLTIEEAGLSDLATDRPDTEGRVIFVLTPAGEIQILGVTSAADGGGSTEVLQLDEPLAQDLDVNRTIVGFCYLVRLADDELEFTYDAPGQASIRLRFITSRTRSESDQSYTLTGSDLQSLKQFTSLITTDDDPYLQSFQSPIAEGPDGYAAAQAGNFAREWQAEISGGVVSFDLIVAPAGPYTSTLYDSGFDALHLSLGFDPVGTEALAWRIDEDTFRLGWFESSSETWLNVEGYSPVLYNTFAIDSTKAGAAGDADLVCFYLKKGYNAIFARLFRDSFSIEYRLFGSPSSPLYLQQVVAVGSNIEVHGMDHQHRRARWISSDYVPPLERQIMGAQIDADPAGVGLYFKVIEAAGSYSDGAGASLELVGEYVDRRVPTSASEPGAGAALELEAGSYDDHRIPTSASEPGAGAALELEAGSYDLIARSGSAADDAAAALELTTGTYEIP